MGSTEEITILDLARQVLAHSGGDPARVQLIPYDQAYESGFEDMQRRVPDIRKIGHTIGWTPTIPLAETLDEIISYVRMQPEFGA